MQTPSDAIRHHRNYDADDYAYLRAIGWTDMEILARWNAEAQSGKGPCRWQSEPAQAKLAAVLRSKQDKPAHNPH